MAHPSLLPALRRGINGTADDQLVFAAADEIERLRKGIQDYLDGNYDHPRKHRHEKGMSCKHGRLYYAECCECDTEHFSALLADEDRAPELKATGDTK